MRLQAILAFTGIPATNADALFIEHECVHVADASDARAFYKALGYTVVKELREGGTLRGFFCYKVQQGLDDHRLEVVEPGWAPPHLAFAVARRDEFSAIAGVIDASRQDFEEIGRAEGDDLCQILFRNIRSGAVMQIVWRREKVFPNVFGEGYATDDDAVAAAE